MKNALFFSQSQLRNFFMYIIIIIIIITYVNSSCTPANKVLL